jgi:orotidine-5'-phosphate decarboxylase
MPSLFLDKLTQKWDENKFVCIGLDPVLEKLPNGITSFFEFNKAIIDNTHDLVLAYKPNSAFYEALGKEGIEFLKQTIDYIKSNHPEIPVILDSKRADIGSTNEGYVKFAFEYLNADAITLHPYLGKEAIEPFLNQKDKGIIILARTSNPGAEEFQNLEISGEPLYLKVAKKVATDWNENGNIALVAGATAPEELGEIRKAVGDLPLLIPGIGAQGGDVEQTVKNGKNSKNQGMIINSSRAIIFASNGPDFSEVARQKTTELSEEIIKHL